VSDWLTADSDICVYVFINYILFLSAQSSDSHICFGIFQQSTFSLFHSEKLGHKSLVVVFDVFISPESDSTELNSVVDILKMFSVYIFMDDTSAM